MKYDFDKVIDRNGTNSVKWMGGSDVLPMWVADMDFPAAPEIADAIRKRAEHGIYGYTLADGKWKDAVESWWSSRYDFEIDKSWMMFASGVIPAVSCAIRAFTKPGDKVCTMTPVYNHFLSRQRRTAGRYSSAGSDMTAKVTVSILTNLKAALRSQRP